MAEQKFLNATYLVVQESELSEEQKSLLDHARSARLRAYAPYSRFIVGAAVMLENGNVIEGNNQENASYPVGICAERVTLSSAAAQFPESAMLKLAITATGKDFKTSEPVSPCGICRQTILEYEQRFSRNIEIILQGEEGKVFIISTVKDILPLYFLASDFRK